LFRTRSLCLRTTMVMFGGGRMSDQRSVSFLDPVHACPLCIEIGLPGWVAEAPKGSGKFACIIWDCPYMTHYGWTRDNYKIGEDGLWVVVQ